MHFFDNVARRGNGVFVCFRIKTNTSAVHLATSLLIRILDDMKQQRQPRKLEGDVNHETQ